MPVREVLRYPHPALKRVARPLAEGEDALARVACDLVDTMRHHPGCVGLAAPQIDEPVRMAAIDLTDHPKAESPHGLLVLVNPEVVRAEGSEVAREGCLSIPELTANVARATRIELSARSPEWRPIELAAHGFEARCALHELDHLDGILFLDRVHSLSDDVFARKRRSPDRGGRSGPVGPPI